MKNANSQQLIANSLKDWRKAGKRIVFTNGCFDLLHLGHIDNLEMARSFGDVLIVGLNADASIKRLKGPSRPVNDETFRKRMLEALACVDAVVLFEEDTPFDLINTIRPDVLVKGGDYLPEQVVGHDLIASYGGELRIIPLTAGFSTTSMIERISLAAKKA
ncbi:MAG: D-glycero-beta-D-manno-heptose 1-phosphate adenylyltransferase [Bacteroidia bacterium]